MLHAVLFAYCREEQKKEARLHTCHKLLFHVETFFLYFFRFSPISSVSFSAIDTFHARCILMLLKLSGTAVCCGIIISFGEKKS